MARFIKATKTTIVRVLRKMAEQAEADEMVAQVYAEEIDPVLDSLLGDDFFGTEGQLDPRGDHRD